MSVIMMHSAKGSIWKEHKYIKRIDGTYYYPNNYKGGRHLDSSGEGLTEGESEEYDSSLDSLEADEIEALALEVIRGNYGNGQTRKDLLGDMYQMIQYRVNEILLGKPSSGSTSASSESTTIGSKKLSEIPKRIIEAANEAISKVTSNKTLAESLVDLGKNVGYNVKSESERKRMQNSFGSKLEDWEETMYDDIESTLKKNPGLFDPKKIASDSFQDFKVTLSEFAGVDNDSLSKEEIERMRKKVYKHFNG